MNSNLFDHPSVGEAFAARAAAHPARTALTIHRAGAEPEESSFANLERRARARATALTGRLAPGERLLIALPTSTEFVELYLACLMSGIVAVPVPVPGGTAQASARVAAVVRDCAPGLVLTTAAERDALSGWLTAEGFSVPVEAVGATTPGSGTRALRPLAPPGPDTLAVLQYSSGSTGTPKGVMLHHAHILANCRGFSEACGVGPRDRFGNWIPLHHDMGLFFQLTTALLVGARSVLMSPRDFVRRPVDWLRMLDEYGITVTAAPNFAFDLCLRLVDESRAAGLDLSSVRILANGSEPVHGRTLTDFSERFAAAGLDPRAVTPGYGLAEATVWVCAEETGRAPHLLGVDPGAAERGEIVVVPGGDRTLVGLGAPGRSFQARIVDPHTRRPLPEGRVGELWLRGDSIGSGYWNRPDLTARVFHGRIVDTPEVATPEVAMPAMGVPEEDVTEVDVPEEDVTEVDVPEVDVPEEDVPEEDVTEVDVLEVDALEVDALEVDVPEVDVPEVDVPEVDVPEVDALEVDALEVDALEVDALEVDVLEVDVPEVDAPEDDTPEEGASQEGTPEAAAGWLRTGDLGCLLDGELFITGRLKELMVLRGRNIYPQDVEVEARAAHSALDGLLGAAFSVPAPDERVVLVHEVNPAVGPEQLPLITAAVRQRLTGSIGSPVRNVVLVRRGTVRRTTSGKIQRGTMRAEFLAGELSVTHRELEPSVARLVPVPPESAA